MDKEIATEVWHTMCLAHVFLPRPPLDSPFRPALLLNGILQIVVLVIMHDSDRISETQSVKHTRFIAYPCFLRVFEALTVLGKICLY